MYEVELKFPVADVGPLERRLAALGATLRDPVDQVDRYFAHPSRDFSRTDEALRLRRDGDAVAITWKGPRIDSATKTRREIELPIAVGPAVPEGRGSAVEQWIDRWTELLEAVGFRPVATVSKRRRPVRLAWHGAEIDVAIDSVAGLGDFVELEIKAREGEVPLARACLESLADELGCADRERRSYLELILASRQAR